MNVIGKKLAALGLAACLLLGLAACGDKEGGDSQQLSGTVYVPTFAGISANVEYVFQGCAGTDCFYFLGNVPGEEHEETNTWTDEDGEEHTETYTYYDYRTGLFRVPLTGGTAEELANFQQSELPEGAEGSIDISGLRVDSDGTLWVTETVYSYTFELPENFDEMSDNKWNYQTGETNTTTLRHLDATGTDIGSIDLTNLAEKAGLDVSYNTAIDSNGNIYTNSDTKLSVLDKDLNLLFTLEDDQMWGNLVVLGDGSVGLNSSYYDEEAQTGGYRLRVVDLANKDWGTVYELSQNTYEVYPGGGEFLFYYRNGDSVYGRKADAADGEKVFSWISADIDESNVQFFTFLEDGRVAAMMRDWADGSASYESALLTPTDASTLPPKTVLTYACMGLDYEVRNQIIEFNKSNSEYRIEVTDYAEFNTGEDTSAGLTKMNTEILAGHVPDFMSANSGMPIGQYAAKGLLEDLWPYIESDEEIGGRAGVMENALKAAEYDGKLYRVFKEFDIRTVIGASKVVGDRTSWTLQDLQAALATMPEGCAIFGMGDTKDGMLRNILACNMDSFVNWSTGECHFDSDSFKSLLTFCNSFPAEFDYDGVDWDTWENDDQRIMSGKQMLMAGYVDSFTGIQRYKAMFGGDISFVGYPMEDGSVGSSFMIMGNSLAMSSTSKNKEAVWSFIREMLLPRSNEEETGDTGDNGMVYRYSYNYPVNKKDFDKMVAEAMTEEFEVDENGQQVVDENGEPVKIAKDSYWISGGNGQEDQWVNVYAATQEDVDQVMDLFNSITSIWNYDENVFNIIQENVGAYFAGDRTVDDTANLIQSAVKLYIGEQR